MRLGATVARSGHRYFLLVRWLRIIRGLLDLPQDTEVAAYCKQTPKEYVLTYRCESA